MRLTSAGVASTLLVCRFLFTAVTSSSAKCGECVSCCAWSKRSSSFLISLCSDWKEIFLKLNKWSNSYRCSLAGICYILKVKNKNTISICKKPSEHRMCSDRTEDTLDLRLFPETRHKKRNERIKILWSGECFFSLSGFSFMNIHESPDCRGRGRAFL